MQTDECHLILLSIVDSLVIGNKGDIFDHYVLQIVTENL